MGKMAGALQGLGRGMQNFSVLIGEKRKLDWTAQQNELAHQRQLNMERLRNQNQATLQDDQQAHAVSQAGMLRDHQTDLAEAKMASAENIAGARIESAENIAGANIDSRERLTRAQLAQSGAEHKATMDQRAQLSKDQIAAAESLQKLRVTGQIEVADSQNVYAYDANGHGVTKDDFDKLSPEIQAQLKTKAEHEIDVTKDKSKAATEGSLEAKKEAEDKITLEKIHELENDPAWGNFSPGQKAYARMSMLATGDVDMDKLFALGGKGKLEPVDGPALDAALNKLVGTPSYDNASPTVKALTQGKLALQINNPNSTIIGKKGITEKKMDGYVQDLLKGKVTVEDLTQLTPEAFQQLMARVHEETVHTDTTYRPQGEAPLPTKPNVASKTPDSVLDAKAVDVMNKYGVKVPQQRKEGMLGGGKLEWLEKLRNQ